MLQVRRCALIQLDGRMSRHCIISKHFMSDYFVLVFVVTIVVTRVALFIHPASAPTLASLRIHHYMYGLVGIAVGLAIHSIVLYAVGAGLFVDEATLLVLGGSTHEENYSAYSLLGTLLLTALVVLLAPHLVALWVWA